MARIRSIKPEFPQSETIGRLSRDARLLYILLWTISDDYGRSRASSRMLASTLFPYDEDAFRKIPGWLAELVKEKCIFCYEVDGNAYLEVCNWLKHQRIDHPGKPIFPEPREDSRGSREDSRNPRLGREGKGEEGIGTKTLSADADGVPFSEIVDAYHAQLPMLPRVAKLSDRRRKMVRARWLEDRDHQRIEYWRDFFAYVAESDFLTGRNGAWTGCDFEWLMNATNHLKVIEGKYNRAPEGTTGSIR